MINVKTDKPLKPVDLNENATPEEHFSLNIIKMYI